MKTECQLNAELVCEVHFKKFRKENTSLELYDR